MVTTANNSNLTFVEPPRLKVVNCLPTLGDAEIGEMFFLINDSSSDSSKIHVRINGAWLKTAALS